MPVYILISPENNSLVFSNKSAGSSLVRSSITCVEIMTPPPLLHPPQQSVQKIVQLKALKHNLHWLWFVLGEISFVSQHQTLWSQMSENISRKHSNNFKQCCILPQLENSEILFLWLFLSVHSKSPKIDEPLEVWMYSGDWWSMIVDTGRRDCKYFCIKYFSLMSLAAAWFRWEDETSPLSIPSPLLSPIMLHWGKVFSAPS